MASHKPIDSKHIAFTVEFEGQAHDTTVFTTLFPAHKYQCRFKNLEFIIWLMPQGNPGSDGIPPAYKIGITDIKGEAYDDIKVHPDFIDRFPTMKEQLLSMLRKVCPAVTL